MGEGATEWRVRSCPFYIKKGKSTGIIIILHRFFVDRSSSNICSSINIISSIM